MYPIIQPLTWESDFFGRKIGKLHFSDKAQSADLVDWREFALLQAKIKATQTAQLRAVQQLGFEWVAGEITFMLELAHFPIKSTACDSATEGDLPALYALFGDAFPDSRWRKPWFSAAERQRFYQHWIRQAVYGRFDDDCLIYKQGDQLAGAVSWRIRQETVTVGLLAVSPEWQGQGVGRILFTQLIAKARLLGATRLLVSTQQHNLAAIQFYQAMGAKITQRAIWFYR